MQINIAVAALLIGSVALGSTNGGLISRGADHEEHHTARIALFQFQAGNAGEIAGYALAIGSACAVQNRGLDVGVE